MQSDCHQDKGVLQDLYCSVNKAFSRIREGLQNVWSCQLQRVKKMLIKGMPLRDASNNEDGKTVMPHHQPAPQMVWPQCPLGAFQSPSNIWRKVPLQKLIIELIHGECDSLTYPIQGLCRAQPEFLFSSYNPLSQQPPPLNYVTALTWKCFPFLGIYQIYHAACQDLLKETQTKMMFLHYYLCLHCGPWLYV